jgi:hypothetical protein
MADGAPAAGALDLGEVFGIHRCSTTTLERREQ